MEGSVSPKSNRLLGLLPPEVVAYLLPHLECINIARGTVLHQPGQHSLKHAIFPVSGLIGRVAMTTDGKSTELTLCGFDGVIGVSILLGGRPLNSQALVLSDTVAFRLPASVMLSAWRRSEAFQCVMLRYVQVILREVIQVALCNKHHTVEQQLSRWLLMAMDRVGGPTLYVTHSVISHLLGVRREGITEAAGKLEAYGVLKRVRGEMTVVHRSALEGRCCECYATIRRHVEDLLMDGVGMAGGGRAKQIKRNDMNCL